jgi:NitT/TauT family transport system substrate-binding protein
MGYGSSLQARRLDRIDEAPVGNGSAARWRTSGQAVKSHFATLPTSWAELQTGKVKTVLTSYDVLGGRHSTLAMYNTEKWKNDNPKLYTCAWQSYRTAMKWINDDKKRGAELFHRFTKSKLKLEDVVGMLTTEGEIHYSLLPEKTMEFAKFLHSIKGIKNMPASWKDYYWENNYNQSGS